MNNKEDNPLVIEAAKFLKDTYKEAYDSIKGQIKSVNNIINIEGVWWQPPFHATTTPDSKWWVILQINNEKLEIEGIVKDAMMIKQEDIWAEVFNQMMDKIKEILSAQMADKIKVISK